MKNLLFKKIFNYNRIFFLFLCFLACILVLNQCRNIPDKISDMTNLIEEIPGFDSLIKNLIEGEPPVSTSIKDAVYEDESMDNFNPEVFSPLSEMPRDNEGSFFILPGLYSIEAQSYCLRAGTYSPRSGGPGYVYAPLKGSKGEIVEHILQNSVYHPEIEQQDIQILLWAIVARTKISDMPQSSIDTAQKLLSKQEMFELNGGALGLIPEKVFYKAIENLPEGIQKILEVERQIREILTQSTSYSYAEMERIAILTGIEPAEFFVRDIPYGRWSKLPDGYYIRFFPYDYTIVRIEIYYPDDGNTAMVNRFPRVHQVKNTSFGGNKGFEQFLCIDHPKTPPRFKRWKPGVAEPGNTASQRLGYSGRKSSGADSPMDKAKTATTWLKRAGSSRLPVLKIPLFLAGELLGFNFSTWSTVISILGGDPPRPDFTIYEKPIDIDIPSIEQGNGISGYQTQQLNALLQAATRITSLFRASVITQDRLGGALKANDSYWASEQALVLCHYKREIGLGMIDVAEKLDGFYTYIEEENYEDDYISAQMIRDYQENLRKNGFSEEALEAARILKLTNIELEEIKQDRLSADPEENEGSLYKMIRYLVDSLKEAGNHWALIPEVDPYWL